MTATQNVNYTYELTLPQILREGMDRHGNRAYVALGAAISAVHGLSHDALPGAGDVGE